MAQRLAHVLSSRGVLSLRVAGSCLRVLWLGDAEARVKVNRQNACGIGMRHAQEEGSNIQLRRVCNMPSDDKLQHSKYMLMAVNQGFL